jgi:polyketide biosynthesis enoyl-CoA hydratase PksI
VADGVVQLAIGADGVARIALDDPATENGLTPALSEGLSGALSAAAARPEVRVVLLSGRPDVFSSGATRGLLDALQSGAREARDIGLPALLLGSPLPIVAAVEGAAVGGGLALALACDIAVAAAERRYGFNFMDLGFTPGMGCTRLAADAVGAGFAAEMMLTGKLYKGRELSGRGLFAHVVPGAEVRARAEEIAARIADKPRRAVELLKESLALPRRLAWAEAVSREHLMHQRCFDDPATRARIAERFGTGRGD